jgi:FKBP-type peptidyl-prolyl cis-trans isomerase 2
MGEKKQKEEKMKKVKQVLIVLGCVLFAIFMVVSSLGTSNWVSIFKTVQPGDTVVVDYTLYDAAGNPVMTSNQQTYKQAVAKGQDVIPAQQLSMTAGVNLTKSIYPVTISSASSTATRQFALFSTEYNAIDQALLGMKTGNQKHIQLTAADMTQQWTADQLMRNGVNMTDLHTGDVLAMGVSDNPEAMATNTSISYTRIGLITTKTNDSVVVDFGYPTADISVVSINAES